MIMWGLHHGFNEDETVFKLDESNQVGSGCSFKVYIMALPAEVAQVKNL